MGRLVHLMGDNFIMNEVSTTDCSFVVWWMVMLQSVVLGSLGMKISEWPRVGLTKL